MLVLEIALGIVLGALLVRVLPQLVGLAAIGATALLLVLVVLALIVAGRFAVQHWEAVLTVAGSLSVWLIGGALARAIETRSRYTVDEFVIVCLSILAMPALAAFSAWVLYVAIRESIWQGVAAAAAGAVLVATAGLVARAFVKRAARRPAGWNAPLPADARLVETPRA